MTTLYIFRHGETDWNKERRIQGNTDIPLNENGMFQAKGLAEKIKDVDFDLVISSHLKRANKTQEIVFKNRDIKTIVTEDLQEFSFGKFEGFLWDDLLTEVGQEAIDKFRSSKDMDYCIGGGESKRAVQKRAVGVIDSHIKDGNYKTVAISTHGGVLRELLVYASGGEMESFKIGNCDHFVVSVEDGKWLLQ